MDDKLIKPLPDGNKLNELIPLYLDKWIELQGYSQQETALKWLFATFPNNTVYDEVMIKVGALDSFYYTQLKYSSKIANRILAIPDFDKKAREGKIKLVDEMCQIIDYKPFSFATKYCSHINPNAYPVYDKFVSLVLTDYRNNDKFTKIDTSLSSMNKNKSYEKDFYPIVRDFRHFYCLDNYTYYELDHLLWLLGKEYFVNYELAKIGLHYVIVSKSEQYSLYELCIHLTRNVLPAKVGDEYIAMATDSDFDFAKRMLSIHCNYMSRKDGLIGDYYLEIDGEETAIRVYRMIYDSTVIVGDKTKEEKEKFIKMKKQEGDNLAGLLGEKANKSKISNKDSSYKITKTSYKDVCKEIIEQYDGEWRQTMKNDYKKRQDKKQSIIDTIKDILKDIECSITFTSYCDCIGVYLNSDEDLSLCQVKNLFTEDMTFEYVDEKGETINKEISSVEDIKIFTEEIVARAKKLCEAKEHNVSNEKKQESVKQSGVNEVKTSDMPIDKKTRQNKMKTQTRINNKKQ